MKEKDWKKIEQRLKNERGILFLGPKLGSVLIDSQWESTEEKIAHHFAEMLDEYEIKYDTSPVTKKNLTYISQKLLKIEGFEKVDVGYEAKEFIESFQSNQLPKIYADIAKLPIKIFIDTSLNSPIEKALKNARKSPQSFFFNFKRPQGSLRAVHENGSEINMERISVDQPLIFHMFGILEEPESLVITQEDQMDFIKNIIQGTPGLPNEILSELTTSDKASIFLGFDLNTWQYRLIMDVLKLRKNGSNYSTLSSSEALNPVNREFYADRKIYGFVFGNKNVESFVEALIARVVSTKKEEKRTVYISYIDEDMPALLKITTLLEPSQNLMIQAKQDVKFASNAQRLRQQALQEADYVLLLLSPDYLINQKIIEEDRTWLTSRGQNDTRTIPIVVKPCLWEEDEAIRALEPIIPNMATGAISDAEYLNIVQQILKRIE